MIRSPMSAQATVRAVFFLQAMSFGGWFVRVGDLQLGLGINEDTLGFAMMGMAVGALLTFPFGPPLVERYGTRLLVLVAIPLTAIGCALSALASDALGLFLTLILAGIGHGFATIAANVESDRVEASLGRRIMNSCHGVWSLGFVAATVIGFLARTMDVSPALQLIGVAVLVTVLTLVVALPMRGAPSRPHLRTTKRPILAAPSKPIFRLIAFVQASNFLEGGAYAWSVIYFRDTFELPVWLETLTLPIFLMATAAGRLFTDPWVDRFGPSRVAATMSLIAFIGVLPIVWAGSFWLSLLGFALLGFGLSCAFPLSISAAARIGDRPASENVAAFSVIQRTISLLVPMLIGLVAVRWGVGAAYAAMAPLPLLSIILSRHLEPRPATAS